MEQGVSQGLPEELSAREREILKLVATGATNQQIAQQLIISVNTVKAHLRNIFSKLGVESRTEAALYAIQHGLVEVAPSSTSAPFPEEAPPSDALPTEAGAGNPADATAIRSSPERVSLTWTPYPGQIAAMLLALLLVLVVAVWPGSGAASSPGGSRLVDMPQAKAREVALEEKGSRWQAKASLPTPRVRFAQAAVNQTILVIGGLTEQGWNAQVEAYDPEADRWERRADKPTAVANIGAAVVRGLVYVPGGLDEDNTVRDILEVYDPATDRWSTRAPLPRPLCAYAIAAVEGGFYLFGGWDGQHYLDTVYSYDVAQDAWRQEPPLRTARGFAAAAALDGRIYLIGGYDGNSEYRLCEVYDPARAVAGQDPWETLAPMSTGRAGHSVAVVQGGLYVVGGGWDSYLAYNERYDVANNVWSTFESPIIGEWRTLGLSALQLRRGVFLYAIGGWNGQHLGVVQAYQASYQVDIPAIKR